MGAQRAQGLAIRVGLARQAQELCDAGAGGGAPHVPVVTVVAARLHGDVGVARWSVGQGKPAAAPPTAADDAVGAHGYLSSYPPKVVVRERLVAKLARGRQADTRDY